MKIEYEGLHKINPNYILQSNYDYGCKFWYMYKYHHIINMKCEIDIGVWRIKYK